MDSTTKYYKLAVEPKPKPDSASISTSRASTRSPATPSPRPTEDATPSSMSSPKACSPAYITAFNSCPPAVNTASTFPTRSVPMSKTYLPIPPSSTRLSSTKSTKINPFQQSLKGFSIYQELENWRICKFYILNLIKAFIASNK